MLVSNRDRARVSQRSRLLRNHQTEPPPTSRFKSSTFPSDFFSPSILHPFTISPSLLHPFTISPFLLHPFTISPSLLHPFTISPSLHPFTISPSLLHPFTISPPPPLPPPRRSTCPEWRRRCRWRDWTVCRRLWRRILATRRQPAPPDDRNEEAK